MPEYQTFLNPTNLDTFWGFVKWVLFFVAPTLMIWVAVVAVGHLVGVIRKAMHESDKDDTDDEYDIYHY